MTDKPFRPSQVKLHIVPGPNRAFMNIRPAGPEDRLLPVPPLADELPLSDLNPSPAAELSPRPEWTPPDDAA